MIMNDTKIDTPIEVLLQENFDYVYTGKNKKGNIIVGLFVEELEDEAKVRYLQVLADEELLYGYFSGIISFYDFILHANQVHEYIKSYSGRTTFSVQTVEKNILRKNFEYWAKCFFRQSPPSFFHEIIMRLPEDVRPKSKYLRQISIGSNDFPDYFYTNDVLTAPSIALIAA